MISRRMSSMHPAHTKEPFLVKRTADSEVLVKQKLHRTARSPDSKLRSDSRRGAVSSWLAARLVHEWQIPPSAPAVPVSFSMTVEQNRHFTTGGSICRLTFEFSRAARRRLE